MVNRFSLDRAASIAVIFAAIVCAGTWTWHYWSLRTRTATEPPPDYAVGDSLSPVRELSGGRPQESVVLVVSSACPICTDSMPFYRKLAAAQKASKSDKALIVASYEPADRVAAYLRVHSLEPEAIVTLARDGGFKIKRTPAILWLDEQKSVRALWYGRIKPEDEPFIETELFGMQ